MESSKYVRELQWPSNAGFFVDFSVTSSSPPSSTSRYETESWPGLERKIVTIVGGFSTALAFARASDLIATVPERHTANLRAGMYSFPLPVPTPEITVSMLWHPRMDADTAHRWLRGCVRDACAEQLIDSSARAAWPATGPLV